MSFPFTAFKAQAVKIKEVLDASGITYELARETNKGLIFCVLSKQDADHVKEDLIQAGFFTTYSKGLKTTRRYISVSYNYPTDY